MFNLTGKDAPTITHQGRIVTIMPHIIYQFFLFIFLGLLLSVSPFTVANIDLPFNTQPRSVNGQIEYFIDKNNEHNVAYFIQENDSASHESDASINTEEEEKEPHATKNTLVEWKKNSTSPLFIPDASSTLWIKAVITPPKKNKDMPRYFLVLHNPLIETVNLFYYGENNQAISYFSGNKKLTNNQKIPLPFLYFPLSLNQEEASTLYLQIQSKHPFFIPLSLYTENDLMLKSRLFFFAYGAIFGLMLFFIYYAFIYFRKNKSLLFIFSGWSALQFLCFSTTSSLGAYLFWPFNMLEMSVSNSVYLLNIIPASYMIIEHFMMRETHKKITEILFALSAFSAFYALFILILPSFQVIKIINTLLVLISLFFSLFLPFLLHKKNNFKQNFYVFLLFPLSLVGYFPNILHLNNALPAFSYAILDSALFNFQLIFYALFTIILFIFSFKLNRSTDQKTIEDIKETQKNLVLSNRHFAFYNELKDRFLGKVGNELLLPIEKLEFEMNALCLSPTRASEIPWQEECRQHITHLKNTIYEIYHYSQLQTGMLKAQSEPFSLSKILKMITENYTPIFHHKNIAFSIEVSDNVPSYFMGDTQIIFQILNHLLDNASKFTEKGQVKILVRRQDNEKNTPLSTILFSVSDTGKGMEKEKVNHIFETFMDKDFMSLARTQGIGIGLATSLHLAKLMRGGINVISTPNKGSVFTVSLQLEEAPNDINLNLESHKKIEALKSQKIKKSDSALLKKELPIITVYYETELDLKFIKNLITENQVQMLITNDFDELTEKLTQKIPDLLIVDVSKNAIKAIKWLESIQKALSFNELKVIIFTQIKDERFKKKCLDYGVKEIYLKPVDKNLISKILSL